MWHDGDRTGVCKCQVGSSCCPWAGMPERLAHSLQGSPTELGWQVVAVAEGLQVAMTSSAGASRPLGPGPSQFKAGSNTDSVSRPEASPFAAAPESAAQVRIRPA